MCNLYSDMSGPEEIRAFARHLHDIVGSKPSQPGVFPDHSAAIARNDPDGVRDLAMARWGKDVQADVPVRLAAKTTSVAKLRFESGNAVGTDHRNN